MKIFLFFSLIFFSENLFSQNNKSGIDTVVNYFANDSVIISTKKNKMILFESSELILKDIKLNAKEISIDFDSSVVVAKSKDKNDKAKLEEMGESYFGENLFYNFKTKKGRILFGETKVENGFYYGDKIKKNEPNIFCVQDGKFTTCELDSPHYYFFSPKMKIKQKDKVIAEPIFLYISDAPVFALPFGIFPNKSGRRSGIIFPAFGEDYRFGRYLNHLGYYFAFNDYTDLSFTGDIFMKGSFALQSNFRYNLKYNFSGNILGSYRKYRYNEFGDNDFKIEKAYSVGIIHQQQISPTSNMDINFRFASNNSFKFTNNLTDALQQTIESRASYSKRFEKSQNSFSISIIRTQNLFDNSWNEILPQISFNKALSFPFRKNSSAINFKWYELIGYNYSTSMSNSNLKNNSEFNNSQNLRQNINLNYSPKFGYFTISPSFSFSDDRKFSYSKYFENDSSKKHQTASGNINSGISVSTRLYGIIQPEIFGISVFRHTFSPSISFSHSKKIYGDALSKASMFLRFSAGNNFEMKTKTFDTLENKIQLMNVNFGIGYDVAKDSLNFSNLDINFHTNVLNIVNIGGNSSFTLYQMKEKTKINNIILPKMENFGVSISTNISNENFNFLFEKDTIKNSNWNLNLSWNFNENKIYKTHNSSININSNFNFTKFWKIAVSGNYDFMEKKFSAPFVAVERSLHCWILNFSWIPTGYYRQWKFEIRISDPLLQDVKITKTRSTIGVY